MSAAVRTTTSPPQHGRPPSDALWGWLFIAPAILLALTFKVIPLLLGFRDSTRRWDIAGADSTSVGAGNFQRLVDDPAVRQSFTNALKLILTLPIWIVAPLIVAFVLYRRVPGWRFFRAIYFLPYIIAPVIAASVFRLVLAPDGAINALLARLGLDVLTFDWLGNLNTALWSLEAAVFWSLFGLGVVIYLAGLGALPTDVLEAAAIDGAGFWRQLRSVIVPLIIPTISYWTLLCTVGMLLAMFPYIHAMTQGGPGYATMLPEYLIYLEAFPFANRGYATSIGVSLFVFIFAFSLVQVYKMYKIRSDS